MENKIKIIVVDDHDIFCKGLKMVLNSIDNVEVIATASNGQELLCLLEKQCPDIIFMDIKMPVMSGIDATKLAKQKYPTLKIIALTNFEDERNLKKMICAGANGFLTKNAKKEELNIAIRSVIAGENYFTDEMKLFIKDLDINDIEPELDLTDREVEVLNLICKGYDSKEISKILFIDITTVEKHRSNMLKKNNCKNLYYILGIAKDLKII